MIKGQDIICFSLSDWDQEMVSNRYHMLTRFAKYNRVFLFERQLTWDDSKKRWWKFLFSNFSNRDNIYLIIPGVILPTGLLSTSSYRHYILKTFQKYHIRNPIFWFYNYELTEFLAEFPHKLSVYHCTEDYPHVAQFNSTKEVAERIANQEKELVEKVNLVFSVSEYLEKKHKKINKNSFLSANAVDFNFYSHAQAKPKDKGESSPIIGYVGNISQKLDFNLIYEVVSSLKDYRFIFVGPEIKDKMLNKVKGLKNTTFLGKRKLKELPGIIMWFDVCLIPFIQDTWFVQASQPLKLFEYMASGKPIVSTPMDCLKNLQDVVYVGQSTKEFLRQIQLALKETSKEKRSKRIRLASQNTWDKRFGLINRKMEKFLCQKPK